MQEHQDDPGHLGDVGPPGVNDAGVLAYGPYAGMFYRIRQHSLEFTILQIFLPTGWVDLIIDGSAACYKYVEELQDAGKHAEGIMVTPRVKLELD